MERKAEREKEGGRKRKWEGEEKRERGHENRG